VLRRTAGNPPLSRSSPVSQESFHPNITGYGFYATTLNRALTALGM
jgi:hypothetical protein